MLQDQLLKYFKETPDFPKPGIVFQDFSPLLRDNLTLCVDALQALFDDEEWQRVDFLVGVESRGFILASALANRLEKGLVLARKAGKLPQPADRVAYYLEYGEAVLEMNAGEGQNVLIVDDVLATGGTLEAAFQLCEKVGYIPVGAALLMDLNLPVRSTLNRDYRSAIKM